MIVFRIAVAVIVVGGGIALAACDSRVSVPRTPTERTGALYRAPGQPKRGGAALHETHEPTAPARDELLPLKTDYDWEGEKQTALAQLDDPETRSLFEQAFHGTFGGTLQQRDFAHAQHLTTEVLTRAGDFAPAYRLLGYIAFNLNMRDIDTALNAYGKSTEIDPNYREGHYAIAGLLVNHPDRRALGKSALDRALALGMPDYRNLAESYRP